MNSRRGAIGRYLLPQRRTLKFSINVSRKSDQVPIEIFLLICSESLEVAVSEKCDIKYCKMSVVNYGNPLNITILAVL